MKWMLRGLAPSLWVVLLALAGATAPTSLRAETLRLDRLSHIHGLAADPAAPLRLYLATHQGLFLATPDGSIAPIGDSKDDLMGFAVRPGDPGRFLASGHSPGGGNLGVMASDDGGTTWRRIADGADGPVDFHALDVSGADPDVVFGVYRGLQVSRDGGRSWRKAGALPPETFDLAASAHDADTLYAAARKGLFVSRDGGASWQPGHLLRRPATMVHVSRQGRAYAFVYGVGLIATDEPKLAWKLLSDGFADRYLLHFAVDPSNPERLYAVVDTGAVLTSADGGGTWTSFEGSHGVSPQKIASGGALYQDLCQSCHGERGVGERPNDMYAENEFGFVAPPLDDSAHAWHHSDGNLVAIILEGSRRNQRMVAFKQMISRADAEALVFYIKSLWSLRSHACQGARHMSCM